MLFLERSGGQPQCSIGVIANASLVGTGSAIRPKDGEYFKVACVRRKAVPEIDEAQGKSALDPISR